jgi:aspartyl-tRNA(Asn)/glutamyl-tRNA(Gln) amidotransferase subunit A
MTATDITAQVHAGRRSALEVVTAALEAARGDDCQIFLSLNENALQEARRVDARVAAGESLPLAGVPVALKDNLCVAGLPATAGSRILEDYVSPYTGTAMQRLLDAGAVVIGKVNLDEFGMGSSGENSAFFPTLNPRDKTRVPGGSSSGSASSVASGIVPIALGTDTGGSIRLPAAFTGCIGMKPTYGRVSRYGVIAFASSLDQVGPFAMSTADLAATLEVICGHDPHDATSLHAEKNFSSALGGDVNGWRVGLVREALGAGNSASVTGAIQNATRTLESLGATVTEVSLPSLEAGLAAYYLIACPEASSNLARYDGMRFSKRAASDGDVNEVMAKSRGAGFGAEVKRRILMGTYALSSGYYDAYYSRALRARALIAQEFARIFENVDVLMLPTAPSAAFKLGDKASDPLSMYLTDVDTVTVNLAGLPGISIPFGFEDSSGAYATSSGLPVGVQFIAPTLEDARLLTVSAALERATSAAFLKSVQSSS